VRKRRHADSERAPQVQLVDLVKGVLEVGVDHVENDRLGTGLRGPPHQLGRPAAHSCDRGLAFGEGVAVVRVGGHPNQQRRLAVLVAHPGDDRPVPEHAVKGRRDRLCVAEGEVLTEHVELVPVDARHRLPCHHEGQPTEGDVVLRVSDPHELLALRQP
jgi:hypothetical protein